MSLLEDLCGIRNSASSSSCTYVASVHHNASRVKVCTAAGQVQIGPYHIQNCKSNSANIATLLNTLKNTLQPVVANLSSPTASDAYTTFFKDIAYAPYVREVLSNITKGASVPSEPGAPSSISIFYCVDGRDQVTFRENNEEVDAYTRCRFYLEAPAMALLGSSYIVICPSFFKHRSIPVQSTASCYTIDPHFNRFVQDGKSLVTYRLWHLMHVLIHYYVYATTQKDVDVYGINACLALPGRKAILNPQSYTYYVTNMRSGCTKFPRVSGRPPSRGSGVELLEVDANSTALNANESTVIVVQNVSIGAVPPAPTPNSSHSNLTSRDLGKREMIHGWLQVESPLHIAA